MARKLVSPVLALTFVMGVAALLSSPTGARGCQPDPNPSHGHDGCSVKCGPCEQVVCDPGGRCPFHCEPIPGCTP